MTEDYRELVFLLAEFTVGLWVIMLRGLVKPLYVEVKVDLGREEGE